LWESGLGDLFARFAGRFARVEPRRLAFGYVRALLAPLERRNGWTIAEHTGRRSPNAVQEMLYSPCWDPDVVRDDVRDYVIEALGGPDGVLIGDESGFVKKGTRSAPRRAPRGRSARPGERGVHLRAGRVSAANHLGRTSSFDLQSGAYRMR
jgi:SRSO17 transposase